MSSKKSSMPLVRTVADIVKSTGMDRVLGAAKVCAKLADPVVSATERINAVTKIGASVPVVAIVAAKTEVAELFQKRLAAASQIAANVEASTRIASLAESIREFSASGPELPVPVPQQSETEFEVVCQVCQRVLTAGASAGLSRVRLAVPPHDCRERDDAPPSGPGLPN